jgi:hypothetical protein
LGCLLSIGALPLSGAVKFQAREGLPIVDGVFVNGRGPYRFLIDTGSSVNLIDPILAKTIGMQATIRREVVTSAGSALLPGSDGNEVGFDGIEAQGQRFIFSDTIRKVLPDVRGVLGQGFLSRFDYLFDVRGKNLEFGKQDVKGNRTEIKMHNGRTAISTSLGDLILDSGADRLVLFGVDPEELERHDLHTISGPQTVGRAFRKLTIEGRQIWGGEAVAIPDHSEPGVAGLMPLGLFRAVFVCNSQGYVVLE